MVRMQEFATALAICEFCAYPKTGPNRVPARIAQDLRAAHVQIDSESLPGNRTYVNIAMKAGCPLRPVTFDLDF
jgi:hypothetical protein